MRGIPRFYVFRFTGVSVRVVSTMVQVLDDSRPRPIRGSVGMARIPPNNLEAEESLLGAMLLSGDATAAAIEICGAEDFYLSLIHI